LEISSELDGSAPFKFDSKDGQGFAHALIEDWKKQGKSEAEAKRIAKHQVGRLLKDLNQDAANTRRRTDSVTRQLWLENIGFVGSDTTPTAFQQQAADKSASTRLSYKKMKEQQKLRTEQKAYAERIEALERILYSSEFSGVCTHDEIQTFLTWLPLFPASKKRRRKNELTYDQIHEIHNLWNPEPLSRSKIVTLLDDGNRQSMTQRICRHWATLENSPKPGLAGVAGSGSYVPRARRTRTDRCLRHRLSSLFRNGAG
jgi:hypothetical protein